MCGKQMKNYFIKAQNNFLIPYSLFYDSAQLQMYKEHEIQKL